MDVWMKRCKKKATCRHCNKVIENGSNMIIGSMWANHNRAVEGARKWKIMLRWHPECWMRQAENAVEVREKQSVEKRGRKSLVMSESVRVMRLSIMRRRAAVTQRIRIEVEAGRSEKILHLGRMLADLEEEIEKYGGVPEKWK